MFCGFIILHNYFVLYSVEISANMNLPLDSILKIRYNQSLKNINSGIKMEQMFYEGNYSVAVKNGTVEIIGKVDSIDYSKLISYLSTNIDQSGFENISIDFRKAIFINSLGIKVFARFIYTAKSRIVLIIDSSIEWQNIAIAPLVNIRPDGQAILRAY